ncbi:MAG: cytidine deaminase [Lentimicrobiaceae bacterium]|jgi:cytidine deaminase|nr:cytidine deaminase [Lentimicrobiaceae bacterium]
MQLINKEFQYVEYDSIAELSAKDNFLFVQAQQAALLAYAPYSEFKVGAAVLLENGTVITGNNQENAAFPSGLCAERVAVFAAASQFPDIAIDTIAITAISSKFKVNYPVAPCGSCRQVLAESEKRQKKSFRLLLGGTNSKIFEIKGIESILPFMFNSENLGM